MSSRLIFTCARNEGPFLIEWVGYHRAIGFSDVLIFTNDCEDGTDAIAERLQAMGLARHLRNPGAPGKGPQWAALRSAALAAELARADWAAHLDLDEFLSIHHAGGRLDDLLSEDADAIAIPWRFFGSAAKMRFEDQPITEQFTDTGPYPAPFPRIALMFKSLFRPSAFQKPGVHAPRPAPGAEPRWKNGNGRRLGARFAPARSMLAGQDAGNSAAQINHYALKSAESFLVKTARGLPNKTHLSIDLGYWAARNVGGQADERLADRGWAAAALAELRQDSVLDALHRTACEWHKQKAEQMLETEEGLALYGALAMMGTSRAPVPHEVARIYRAMNRFYGKARRK